MNVGILFLGLALSLSLSSGVVDLKSSQAPTNKAAYRHYYRGLSYYGEGEFSKASTELGRAYKAWPDNFNFSLAFSLVLSQDGKYHQALRILDDLTIRSTDPYQEHKKALHFFVRAMVLHFGGEHPEAISALEKGILWQKETDNKDYLASFYNALGYTRLHHQGRGSNHNGLGEHYHVHRRDMEKAMLDFEQALRLNPQHPAALANFIQLSDSLGKTYQTFVEPKDRSRGLVQASSLVTGLPQDVHRVMELADFDEVVLIVDISGSMTEEKVLCMGLTRFEVMRNLGLHLVDQLPTATQIGLGTIGGDCGDTARTWEQVGSLDRRELRYAVRFLNAHGTTPMMERLKQAQLLFSDNPTTTKGLFLISDGANVCPEGQENICSWAGRMRGKGITLNVLTFLDVSYNNIEAFAEYGCLADNTGGRIFYLDNVNCAFTDISYQLLNSLQMRLPDLQKVYCWGPNIKSLWAIFPE